MRRIFGDKPWKSTPLYLLIIFLGYTLCGFFLVPYVLKTQLLNYVENNLHQRANLEDASFNPFLLQLRLKNLLIETPEQAPLLSLGELFIDFDSFGLSNRTLQFTTISLSEPDITVEIDSEGKFNLKRLIPAPSEEIEALPAEEPGALPRLILQNITITQGRIRYTQLDRSEVFKVDLNPLNVNITHFSTLPEDGGHYTFTAALSDSESLDFSGTVQLEPLAIAGHLALSDIQLNRGGDYLQEQLLFKVSNGRLSVDSDFVLNKNGPKQSIRVQASNTDIAIKQLQLETLKPTEPLLSLPSITLQQGAFAWPEQSIAIEALLIEQGSINSWLTSEKVFNYTQLVKTSVADPASAPDEDDKADAKPWQINLQKIQLKELLINFDDRSLSEPARQTVQLVDLSLSPFNLAKGAEFDLSANLHVNNSGKATIQGKVGALPAMAQLAIALRDTPLPPISNYLHDRIKLKLTEGSVDADLQLGYGKTNSGSLNLSGDVDIKQLHTFDLVDQKAWLSWQNLSLKQLALSLESGSLNIAKVELLAPYFDLVVFANGETRLTRMLKPGAQKSEREAVADTAATTSTAKEKPFSLTIGQFQLVDGSMDFKDLTLPIDFATHIHRLNGQVDNISSSSATNTQIKLDGKIDQFGTANIKANMLLSAPTRFSEFKLDFNNVDIASASPYSGKFAGYAIDAGKLSLDLAYHIEDGQMHGNNRVLLKQLKLGQAVDSPDAVSLPLKLAVALMKDVNGNIDIDLPVEGDLNNPSVRVGSIVWKAFTNLLIKVVASPFKMLGSLFDGGDVNNLESVVFAPGSSQLSAVEQKELRQLAMALHQKPALALTINTCYSAEADIPALQTQQFEDAYKILSNDVENRVGANPAEPPGYQSEVLASMYLAAFDADKLSQLKRESEQSLSTKNTSGGENKPPLEQVNKLIDQRIRAELIRAQTLSPQALSELASQRGDTILNAMSATTISSTTINSSSIGATKEAGQALLTERIQLNKPVEIVDFDDGIACPLKLSAL